MRFRTYILASFLAPLALFGAAIIHEQPVGAIMGQGSLLNRPEGIAFSPDGNFVAIASSDSYRVLFYRTSDCHTLSDQVSPVFVLGTAAAPLAYPHDVAFSADGENLAVACRHSNKVTIHKKDPLNGFYEQHPFAVIDGAASSLKGINAVKYSPAANILAVCDVAGHQVALYRYSEKRYDTQPCQVLRGPITTIDRPDGLGFSSDGKLLAVTSHGTHSVLIYERLAHSDHYYSHKPTQIIKGEQTGFCYTHSLCFHPLDDTLAVSSAGGRRTLSLFRKLSEAPPYYSLTPSQTFEIYNPATIDLQRFAPEEGGVKGVAFSADGSTLGICASDIADPAKAILFYAIE